METSGVEDFHRFPTTLPGGLRVCRIEGHGAGEIHADGDITSKGAVYAEGAKIAGACEFGTPDCPTTIRGRLEVEGAIVGPAMAPADEVTLELAPSTWTPVPDVAGSGRLLFILAETDQTSAAFLAVRGIPGCASTLLRATGTSSHLVLRNEQAGLEIACIVDPPASECSSSGEDTRVSGIASAICMKSEAAGGCGTELHRGSITARLRLISAHTPAAAAASIPH